MQKKRRVFSNDGDWEDYRENQYYYDLLNATSWMWVKSLEASLVPHKDIKVGSPAAIRAAYERVTLHLPQLPMEWGNNDLRFERSRWRQIEMPCGKPVEAHCEHPWTKLKTRQILEGTVLPALRCGVHAVSMVEPVAEILDARQDTVLLPHAALTKLNVVADTSVDGMLEKYGPAIRDQKIRIVDRKTGQILDYSTVLSIENEVRQRVEHACSNIHALVDAMRVGN